MYDIIIIGAGTAGLSAAIYGVRAGKSVLVLEASSYGGQIINTPEIENYPGIKNISGYEFATNLYNQAISLGAEVKYEKVTGILNKDSEREVRTEANSYLGKTVILATGAKNRALGLPKEQELTGMGISYCATCDGAFFRGKDVVVNGGGNTALEDAMFLANYCNKVSVIHRRDSFRGEEKLLMALKEKPNVTFILNSRIVELIGDDQLSSIVIENTQTGEQEELPVNGLFVAIGQEPENKMFADVVALNDKGYINGSEDCRTNAEGIFVAGDCRTKSVRQLTTAASDGAVAALAACEFIG